MRRSSKAVSRALSKSYCVLSALLGQRLGQRGRSSVKRIAFGAAVLTGVLNVLAGAQAQTSLPPPTAGQLMPSTFEPRSDKPLVPTRSPGAAPTNAPPGAAGAMLLVGSFVIEGGDPGLADETNAILSKLRGVRVPVASVYEAAAKIQALYAERGHFLDRIIIPPQHVIDGGALQLKVARGFIDVVDVQGLADPVRARVQRVLARLVKGTSPSREAFDRALLIAADTPGLDLKTELTPSDAALGTRLTVTGRYQPIAAQVSFDNSLPRSMGVGERVVSGAMNSVFGFGEQVYGSVAGPADFEAFSRNAPRRLGAIGVTLPLSADGLNANVEYSASNTLPITTGSVLATKSLYRRLGFKLSYPMVKTFSTTFLTRIAFDVVNEDNTAANFDQTLYRDRVRALRAGVDFNHAFGDGTQAVASLDVSQGLNILGARGASQATVANPISRDGANDRFTKLEARAKLHRELFGAFAIDFSARGQYALGGPLLSSEKFVIGGTADLSGTSSGALSGDNGWAARAEWQYHATAIDPHPIQLTPYLFAARGEVFTLKPTAAEPARLGAVSFGLGLRGTVPVNQTYFRQADWTLEAAREINDTPALAPNAWRMNLTGSLRF